MYEIHMIRIKKCETTTKLNKYMQKQIKQQEQQHKKNVCKRTNSRRIFLCEFQPLSLKLSINGMREDKHLWKVNCGIFVEVHFVVLTDHSSSIIFAICLQGK